MDEKDDRDESRPQGFQENPAPQGLKTPPEIEPGEDSGEWTRGGGTDPNEETQDDGDEPRAAPSP
jgi:hypothetical protein